MQRFVRILLMCVLMSAVTGTVILHAPVAQAQTKKLESLLKKGMSAYDNIELEDAEKHLSDGIALAEQEGIEGEVVGKLHIMMGVLKFASTGAEGPTEDAFVEGLKADAAGDVPDVYRTPILDEIMERARARVPAKTEPPKNSGVDTFTHEPIATANAKAALEFEAFVPADMAVYKMFVHVRPLGAPTYEKIEMEPTDATRFAITLDGDEVTTSQLDYYITAEDRGGSILGRSGDDLNPNNIVVMGSSGIKNGDKDKDDGKDKNEPKASSDKNVFVDLAVGTDIGFLVGGDSNQPTANPSQTVSPGLAPAFGHAMLGVGYIINPKMRIGLDLRVQFAPSQSFDGLEGSSSLDPGSGFWDTKVPCFGLDLSVECLIRLRYKYFLKSGDGVNFYSSVGVGVGRIRNWLRLRQPTQSATDPGPICTGKSIETDSNGNKFCFVRDTVRTGWFNFGVGGGISFPLSDFIDFTIDSFLQILVPDTSINLDVQGGLTFEF